MLSKTFTFITRVEVPPELDHLHNANDRAFQLGTLHNRVAGSLNRAFGGYSSKEKTIPGRVIDHAKAWVNGLEIDHINGDPFDNQRENLEMVTHAENNRRRRKYTEQIYLLPPVSRPGLREYAFVLTLKLDEEQAPLLHMVLERYHAGKMQYRALNGVIRMSSTSTLAGGVLKSYGVEVPPGATIDHINNDQGLNLPHNLRVVTMAINNRNKGNSRLQASI